MRCHHRWLQEVQKNSRQLSRQRHQLHDQGHVVLRAWANVPIPRTLHDKNPLEVLKHILHLLLWYPNTCISHLKLKFNWVGIIVKRHAREDEAAQNTRMPL
jgi:hypothetical protein